MRHLPFCRLLLRYLRDRLKFFIVYALFLSIFFMVHFLYRLPLEPVFYAALLSTVTGILFSTGDFIRYMHRHVVLLTLLAGIRDQLGGLPSPGNLLEQDYQELVKALQAERAALVSQTDSRLTERNDYYTLWAHQIKTPISAMRLLLQTDEACSCRPFLESELFQIERYVELALQYLRLDSISSDLLLCEYSLDGLVRQAVRKYAPVFIQKNLSLHLDDLNTAVLTDEKWLVFVVEQLLSNALKYTSTGAVSIYLEPPASKILVIEDTGIGICEEDIPRIFERGFTGFNGRMDKKSTGLGLYLCRRVLERLSHTIRIASKPGEGTRVYLDLSTTPLEVE